MKSVQFGNLKIQQFFANDMVLLASSARDLNHTLERFAAKCEAARGRVSTSKSKAMVVCWKMVDCSLRDGGELLPQVNEFKYLGVLSMSDRKMDSEVDRRFVVASAVIQAMHQTFVLKRELN